MNKKLLAAAAGTLFAVLPPLAADACTRITYMGQNETVLTGRTMDWSTDDDVTLHIMPRGVHRTSHTKDNPVSWESKYGSVIAVSFGSSLNSGMNEQGLAADCLWLDASDYGSASADTPQLAGNDVIAFLMDNFATVEEAVAYFRSGKVAIAQDKVPGTDFDLKLHFMLTDKTGNNAVLEFLSGRLEVYEFRGAGALTNDPQYTHMKTIEKLYRERGLVKNMPGSSHAVDRYLRAEGWMELVKADEADAPQKVSDELKVLSVMRAVSTPLGLSDSKDPQNCSTLWRAVTDLTHGTFMIDSAFGYSVYRVKLSELDFTGKEKQVRIIPAASQEHDLTALLP